MYYSTAAHDADMADYARQDAINAAMEDEFGVDWEERMLHGERFLSERDFAPDADVDAPSDADWSAFLEMAWVDPAERWLD